MKRILVTLLLLSNPVLASDPDNVSLVQGEAAPYSGILMPVPRAQRVELINIDLATCTKRLDLGLQDNDLAQKRVTNLTAENTRLEEANAKKSGFWPEFGSFVLGAGMAVLITFGVSRATK